MLRGTNDVSGVNNALTNVTSKKFAMHQCDGFHFMCGALQLVASNPRGLDTFSLYAGVSGRVAVDGLFAPEGDRAFDLTRISDWGAESVMSVTCRGGMM